jgi:5-methylcytosine-specific restriction enzyme subunit McrC
LVSVVIPETSATVATGSVGRIPVRNLWLLMLYASELYRTEHEAFAGAEDNPDALADLVARLLANEVEIRLRRQLTESYQPKHAELNRVRGRIDMLTTDRRQLLARGRVACRFEDMTIDTPRNQFVRAALEKIAALATTVELTRRCRALATTLRGMGVAGLTPTRAALSLERFSRNDANDRRMVAAATLAFDMALPSEAGDAHWLAQPQRQEAWVRHLFEKAVAGFYGIALQANGWVVRPGRSLYWQIEEKTAGIHRILPSMRTDIMLEHAASQRRLVIDTKFAAILSQGWYRDQTLRNAYLYQIYAYLRSQVGQGDELVFRV